MTDFPVPVLAMTKRTAALLAVDSERVLESLVDVGEVGFRVARRGFRGTSRSKASDHGKVFEGSKGEV